MEDKVDLWQYIYKISVFGKSKKNNSLEAYSWYKNTRVSKTIIKSWTTIKSGIEFPSSL